MNCHHVTLVFYLTIFVEAADGANSTSGISKLEERVGFLESHTRSHEQKEAAVLSNVLTKQTQLEESNRNLTTNLRKIEDELQHHQSVPNGIANGNSTSRIPKLEERVGFLESHSHAQEQKEAAVLSSVLSKLTQLEENNKNMTTYIRKLEDELRHVKSRLNESVTNGNVASVVQEVSFEAVFDSDSQGEDGLLKFTHLLHNTCLCYLPLSGTFTALTSGTYHVWYKVIFESNDIPELRLELDGKSTEVTSPILVTKQNHKNHGILSGFRLMYLQEYSEVSMFITQKSTVLKGSKFAAVLLH